MERAILAKNVEFAVLNLMSDNPGMRWDIVETRAVIGYDPQDGHGEFASHGTDGQIDGALAGQQFLAPVRQGAFGTT